MRFILGSALATNLRNIQAALFFVAGNTSFTVGTTTTTKQKQLYVIMVVDMVYLHDIMFIV